MDDTTRRHESIDHEHPTDAGVMDPAGDEVPGTGIFGDETLVEDAAPGRTPGIYPAPASGTGGIAHPGPTPAAAEDETGENRGPQR